ncbi:MULTISPECIES: hypothetical protein [unclassified Kitasatospora]|uniref:hypothetical protein n=1 Tax=unclassified Kitasatospora TaxID=2633591 RepID=UPI000708AD26|nr:MULTISPECIES: hypothetical protein [unclassified Kitasatospora]KQV13338.1 hypothetical protein ASC99_08985 [Kitasatospora sp. Root107]KRB75214.1 hypothetical protein ASE03_14405 [Kitasatospora sp. Root187]
MSHEERPENLPALRAKAPVSERETFASRLRPLFQELGVSYRVYGKERHYTASVISRYLNGERIPEARFLVDLLQDLADAGRPVDEADQADLLRLREQALRGGGAVQVLQAQLEETQLELADCRLDQARLAEQLGEREDALGLVEQRLRALRSDRDQDAHTHAEQLAARMTEYLRVERDRDQLREQVEELREDLLRERAWALRVEEQCRLLLWQLRLTAGQGPREGSFGTLMSSMDRAPIGELVGFAAQVDDRHLPVLTELLRSVGRDRPVSDAVALFVALHEAGKPQQAEAALPAAVLGRTVPEVSDLVSAFTERGLDGYTATVVRTVVEHHAWPDIAELVADLHTRGLTPTTGDTVAAAAAVYRPPQEVAALLVELATVHELPLTADHCLETVARERAVPDLLALTERLAELGRYADARRLTAQVLRLRSAAHAGDVLSGLQRGWYGRLANETFDELVHQGAPARLVDVLTALDRERSGARIEQALRHAVSARPVAEVADLVRRFDSTQLEVHAADLAARFVLHRSPAELPELASALSEDLPALLSRAARSRPVPEHILIARQLHRSGLHSLGIALLADAVRSRSSTDAHAVLTALPDLPEAAPAVLAGAADRPTTSVVRLVVDLRTHGQASLADALLLTAEKGRGPIAVTELRQAVEAEEARVGVARRTAPAPAPLTVPTPTPARPLTRGPAKHARSKRTPTLGAADLPAQNARLIQELETTRELLAAAHVQLDLETARREQAEARLQAVAPSLAPLGG